MAGHRRRLNANNRRSETCLATAAGKFNFHQLCFATRFPRVTPGSEESGNGGRNAAKLAARYGEMRE